LTRALSLAAVAELVDGELRVGDPEATVRRVLPVDAAAPDAVAFVAKAAWVEALATTRAGVVLVTPALLEQDVSVAAGVAIVVTPRPYVGFARLAQAFAGEVPRPVGIHPSAVIEAGAELGADVAIGPFVHVAAGAKIGDGAVLHAGVHLGPGAAVGAGSVLYDHVVVRHGCTVGARCILHAGVVVGADGFGFAAEPVEAEGEGEPGGRIVRHVKIPQVGDVVIEDEVEIGANTCVDRGALGTTRIGAGTKIDNLVQVGHNVQIGPRCLLVAQSGVAGSSRLGPEVTLAAQAGISGHLSIGPGALIYGQAGVTSDVGPDDKVGGTPAMPAADFFRNAVRLRQLGGLFDRVKKLERALSRLRDAAPSDP
jgi:UDP-3-O-[3-hydroxymyristoyl] glucosamine N-acyltransferase